MMETMETMRQVMHSISPRSDNYCPHLKESDQRVSACKYANGKLDQRPLKPCFIQNFDVLVNAEQALIYSDFTP